MALYIVPKAVVGCERHCGPCATEWSDIKRGSACVGLNPPTPKSSPKTIRLKFDDGVYTLEDVKRLVAVCFADSEADAKGTATVVISLGMTIDEVIKAKGAPKTRVDLGAKTILTYEDMKPIFTDGKLSDVQ